MKNNVALKILINEVIFNKMRKKLSSPNIFKNLCKNFRKRGQLLLTTCFLPNKSIT